jgi:nicotinate-nucleotide adenylyltransferase
MAVAATRRRIGVMGGTFDPIHVGHLIVAAEALHALNLTEVVFVPSANPWQKTPSTDASHRLEMVRLATASEPKFRVSTVDIDRGGNTYTVDTLADLKSLHPDADLFLLLGSDALNNIHTWKDFERIFSLAHVVCLARPGHEPRAQETPAGAVTLLEVPGIDVSSTDCRDRLRYGRPVRFMVTSPVLEYIEQHHLYRRDA